MRTQIAPIQVISKPNGEYISLNINPYVVGGINKIIKWDITSVDNEWVVGGETEISDEEFDTWAQDDEYIINLIINKLNLTKI